MWKEKINLVGNTNFCNVRRVVYKVCKGKVDPTRNFSSLPFPWCISNIKSSWFPHVAVNILSYYFMPLICGWADLFVFIYSSSLNFAVLCSWELRLKTVIMELIFLKEQFVIEFCFPSRGLCIEGIIEVDVVLPALLQHLQRSILT